VPQGSNLGPLLFLLVINDISECIENSHILLFADDLKLYARIESIEDSAKLQKDLDNVKEWCDRNKFVINTKKCPIFYTERKVC